MRLYQFWQFHKNRLVACYMQLAALAARSIGVMRQAAFATCIICKYLDATKQHFACCPMWRHAVRSIAYASRGICNVRNFFEHDFWPGA
jgi:hypothetical protein